MSARSIVVLRCDKRLSEKGRCAWQFESGSSWPHEARAEAASVGWTSDAGRDRDYCVAHSGAAPGGEG